MRRRFSDCPETFWAVPVRDSRYCRDCRPRFAIGRLLNANTRHTDALAAQRGERARVRSQRHPSRGPRSQAEAQPLGELVGEFAVDTPARLIESLTILIKVPTGTPSSVTFMASSSRAPSWPLADCGARVAVHGVGEPRGIIGLAGRYPTCFFHGFPE